MKVGVLLINLGTPKSFKVSDVRSYLREFLMDERVIDIPFFSRFLLVNFIIAPFRARSSAKLYKKLWTSNGSPLFTHSLALKKEVAKKLGNDFFVELAMRYKEPSIKKALKSIQKKNVTKIIVIPLYPQYASATTGSTIVMVNRIVSKWEVIPTIKSISNFYYKQGFVQAWKSIALAYLEKNNYEAYLFSYHGLPKSQILKADNSQVCYSKENCCNTVSDKNYYCYRSQCIQTTLAIANALGLDKSKVHNCFQSRLGKSEWIKPYAEDKIKELAKSGVKSVLAFSPAFVSDCLETTIEVGKEYKESFLEHGGERWTLVESLNSNKQWVDFLKKLVLEVV